MEVVLVLLAQKGIHVQEEQTCQLFVVQVLILPQEPLLEL